MSIPGREPVAGQLPRQELQVRAPSEAQLARFSREDQVRLQRILTEPVSYLDHASFARAKTAKTLFGKEMQAADWTQPWCNSAEAHGMLDNSTLPISTLKTEQEQRLFLQLNYARYRMSTLLKQFDKKRLTLKATTEILWWHSRMVAARCEIVQANVPLVLAMAKRTRMSVVDYAELISEGNMALLRSVDKFDCGRGFKFSTYACRAILKSFSRVSMRSSRYRGRFPTEFDPSLEKSDYQDLQRDEIESGCVDDLKYILKSNSADLNDVEAKVLEARFALGQPEGPEPAEPKTLEQVGTMIGVTKERVRQIQNRALSKLREKLSNDFLAA
jgi:RNA polymerase sigma factor (sigma-70 family)